MSREFQWEDDHCHVRLVFHIQEGSRYQVTATQVEENTSQNVILRQVPSYPIQTLTYPGRPDRRLDGSDLYRNNTPGSK